MTATTQRMIVERIKDVQQYMDMGWSVTAALRMVKTETTLTGAAWEAVVNGAN